MPDSSTASAGTQSTLGVFDGDFMSGTVSHSAPPSGSGGDAANLLFGAAQSIHHRFPGLSAAQLVDKIMQVYHVTDSASPVLRCPYHRDIYVASIN